MIGLLDAVDLRGQNARALALTLTAAKHQQLPVKALYTW